MVQPIAVTTFDNFKDKSSNMLGEFLSYKIYTELFNTYHLNVNHRDDLSKILREYQLYDTGLFARRDAVEIGNLTGAKTLLIGKAAGNINESWYLNLSLIDLSGGILLWTGDYVNIGDDFLKEFNLTEFQTIDLSGMSKLQRKIVYELIHCKGKEESLVAIRKGLLSMILNRSMDEKDSLTFTTHVIDSLLRYQEYRIHEIDSLYINRLKTLEKLRQEQ